MVKFRAVIITYYNCLRCQLYRQFSVKSFWEMSALLKVAATDLIFQGVALHAYGLCTISYRDHNKRGIPNSKHSDAETDMHTRIKHVAQRTNRSITVESITRPHRNIRRRSYFSIITHVYCMSSCNV